MSSRRRQRSRLVDARDVANGHTTPPQHHDNAHSRAHNHSHSTQGHTVAVNGVRGVKIEKPRVTGSWKAAKRRSNHLPHPPHTHQSTSTTVTTNHKNTVKPQTTTVKTTVKPQKNHGQTTKHHGHVLFCDGHGSRKANHRRSTNMPKPLATSHIFTTHTTYHAPQATLHQPHNHEPIRTTHMPSHADERSQAKPNRATRHRTTPSHATPKQATTKTGQAAPSLAVCGAVLQIALISSDEVGVMEHISAWHCCMALGCRHTCDPGGNFIFQRKTQQAKTKNHRSRRQRGSENHKHKNSDHKKHGQTTLERKNGSFQYILVDKGACIRPHSQWLGHLGIAHRQTPCCQQGRASSKSTTRLGICVGKSFRQRVPTVFHTIPQCICPFSSVRERTAHETFWGEDIGGHGTKTRLTMLLRENIWNFNRQKWSCGANGHVQYFDESQQPLFATSTTSMLTSLDFEIRWTAIATSLTQKIPSPSDVSKFRAILSLSTFQELGTERDALGTGGLDTSCTLSRQWRWRFNCPNLQFGKSGIL